MVRYEFFIVGSVKELFMRSTDPAQLEAFVSQLQQYFPEPFHPRRKCVTAHKLPTGEIYGYSIDLLGNEGKAQWWVIKQLCLLGWEPFNVASDVHYTDTDIYYYFRRKVNA